MKAFFKYIKKIIFWGFITSFVYMLLCIVMMPPITLTQIGNSFSYGLKRDYISWDEMGENIKYQKVMI